MQVGEEGSEKECLISWLITIHDAFFPLCDYLRTNLPTYFHFNVAGMTSSLQQWWYRKAKEVGSLPHLEGESRDKSSHGTRRMSSSFSSCGMMQRKHRGWSDE